MYNSATFTLQERARNILSRSIGPMELRYQRNIYPFLSVYSVYYYSIRLTHCCDVFI